MSTFSFSASSRSRSSSRGYDARSSCGRNCNDSANGCARTGRGHGRLDPVEQDTRVYVDGTLVFGTNPRQSVLDPFCRTHDVENLFVVDASFFPSSAAVNPALEKVVGGKLFDRPGGPRPVEITPLGSEVLDVAPWPYVLVGCAYAALALGCSGGQTEPVSDAATRDRALKGARHVRLHGHLIESPGTILSRESQHRGRKGEETRPDQRERGGDAESLTV